jgi:hypothetical protein
MKLISKTFFQAIRNLGKKQLVFRCTCLAMLVLSCSVIRAQVDNKGGVYIAGNVYMKASFVNNSSAAYQNDGNLSLTGDFTNNQSAMPEGTGTTQFIGTAIQNIQGTQSSIFHHVYLSNPAGVLMKLNTTMGGTISTVVGSLYFNGYALTMGMINTAYTNTSAFNVTNTSDLNITGDAGAGNGIYFDPAANTLHNLAIASGATGTLGNALNITAGTAFGTVTADGNFDAAGFLTLKSDADGTARVASSLGNITGYATVERYIPPRRAWRFMSVPINNDTLMIRTAWQEGVNNPSLSVRYDPHPGYGTHITYDNNPSIGFDVNTTWNTSIKIWLQNTNNWSNYGPSPLYNHLTSFPGYCLFVRGSRAVDLNQATNAIADPTVLRETGTLNNGTWSKTYPGLVAGNAVLVGNPYASSVDITSVLTASTGIYNNKFYVWDPALAGSYGVGGYITYSNGIMTPITPNYPVPTTIIQGSQAFLVQSSAPNVTINFKQNDKTASEKDIFARQAGFSPLAIYTNLLASSTGGNLILADGVAAGLDNSFSEDNPDDDAPKLWNFYENISLYGKGKYLSIQFRPIPILTDTLFYRMYLKQQPYTLQIFARNMSADKRVRAWLVDNYLKTRTEINLYDTISYSFTPNPDTTSYRNRFMLVFNKQFGAAPVPVTRVANQGDSLETGNANSMAATTPGAGVFPNPVTGNSFTLKLNNFDPGDYTVSLYSSKGLLLLTRRINYIKGANSYTIHLPPAIAAGTYTLQLLNSDGKASRSMPVVIAK